MAESLEDAGFGFEVASTPLLLFEDEIVQNFCKLDLHELRSRYWSLKILSPCELGFGDVGIDVFGRDLPYVCTLKVDGRPSSAALSTRRALLAHQKHRGIENHGCLHPAV